MAQLPTLNASDRWFSTLNTSVNSSITSWVLPSSGATGLTAPTIIHCGSEKVKVTAIAVDTPSAGLDTLTVERGYGGTTAASHSSGTALGHFNYREFYNEDTARLAVLESFIYGFIGARNGVCQDGGLQVQATGTPSMSVEITAGTAMVYGQPVRLAALATVTFTAPTGGNNRIDVIRIDQNGAVSVVTGTPGGSPTAPATGTAYEKLAEVYLRTGSTSVKNTDDATNGYITEAQTYL